MSARIDPRFRVIDGRRKQRPMTSNARVPRTLPSTLIRRLETLDRGQLGIVELVVAAIQRGTPKETR